MKKLLLVVLFGIFSSFLLQAQQTSVKGIVKESNSTDPISEVIVSVEGTKISTLTDSSGSFKLQGEIPYGEQILTLIKSGFISKRYPIVINEGKVLNLEDLFLETDSSLAINLSTISLSDDELNADNSGADNISGLLQSSMDIFSRTAAFEFSSSFFRVRGLDSENGTVLINGIQMNKMYNGRPQWSNWGGLNDVDNNQILTTGLNPSSYTFGGPLGTSNIDMRASGYRKGGRVTYSASNRSYTNRIIGTYATGELEGGWSLAVSIARRWGEEGYQDATLYDSNSFFASIEKKFNDKHAINFTSIYTPNRRGKSSPNTQEVYDLKGIKYNEYWGMQSGSMRNSRIRRIEEPISILSHYWTINEKTNLNTNIAYQFGELGNSRLDWGGSDLDDGNNPIGRGANPSPTYYQKLPSYYLRNDPSDFEGAYKAEKEFINNGQINWDDLYEANITNTQNGGNAIFALYEDRSDDKEFTANTIFDTELSENITLNAAVIYKNLRSSNFAQVIDLLGAETFLDVDGFADVFYNEDGTVNTDAIQNDTNNPFRLVQEGDKFRYNYNLYANTVQGFTQLQFKYNKIDFFLAGSIAKTSYQREGLYNNGGFPDEGSYGKGRKVNFDGFGAKGGFTYKFSGKHLFNANAGYLQKAPTLRNTFSNPRENHDVIGDRTDITLNEELIKSADASYIFRSPIVNARLTAYYNKVENASEVSFYYADGVGGDNNAFVQEILQGVEKLNIGTEIGLEAQVTPTIKLKGAAAIGQFTYDNNPNLYVTTEPGRGGNIEGADSYLGELFTQGYYNFGKAYLKDYKLAAGPHKAYSLGFEYRDPDYWWFGATANFFSEAYADVSNFARTSNFATDYDGIIFDDYDPEIARELLRQEKFDNYMVVNLVGGKSWKVDDYYIGFFASINNLFDTIYKSGGFEQARAANYRELRDDKQLDTRVFGNKYWYGRGTNFFLNLYLRF